MRMRVLRVAEGTKENTLRPEDDFTARSDDFYEDLNNQQAFKKIVNGEWTMGDFNEWLWFHDMNVHNATVLKVHAEASRERRERSKTDSTS